MRQGRVYLLLVFSALSLYWAWNTNKYLQPNCNISSSAAGQYNEDYINLLRSYDTELSSFPTNKIDVFIFSHRRSGTHFTVNLVRYSFENVRVWKMNHASCGNCTLLRLLHENGGKIIHVSRDPKNVAVSHFSYAEHVRKLNNISTDNFDMAEFLRSTHFGEYWQLYTGTCFKLPHIFQLQYEQALSNISIAVESLSRFLKIPTKEKLDAVPATDAVQYNGGTSHWQEHFTNDTLRFLYDDIERGTQQAKTLSHCPCETNEWNVPGSSCDSYAKLYV